MPKEIYTDVPMPALDCEMGSAILRLTTDKATRGVSCCAAIHYINKEGNITFDVFGDFRTYLDHDIYARATKETMMAKHSRTFHAESIELLKSRALHFYATR